MKKAPSLVLSPKINVQQINIIKFALFSAALICAGVGVFSEQLGFKDKTISYIFFGVAFMDIIMAFILPNIIKNTYEKNNFSFFENELLINYAQKEATVPYSNLESIERIQTPKQREKGFIDIHLNFHDPIKKISPQLFKYKITNLDESSYPIDKIKKIVDVKIISS